MLCAWRPGACSAWVNHDRATIAVRCKALVHVAHEPQPNITSKLSQNPTHSWRIPSNRLQSRDHTDLSDCLGAWLTGGNLPQHHWHGVQVMQPRLAPGSFKALTTLLRLVNNVVGGFSFVYLAKLFKVQSSGDSSAQELLTA